MPLYADVTDSSLFTLSYIHNTSDPLPVAPNSEDSDQAATVQTLLSRYLGPLR